MPSGSDYDRLIRQIRILVRALAVIVAGGRVVAAPALSNARVEGDSADGAPRLLEVVVFAAVIVTVVFAIIAAATYTKCYLLGYNCAA